MRTLLMLMFATTIVVGTSFGQNTNPPQGYNAHDAWIRLPPASPYTQGYNVVGAGNSSLWGSPSIIDATAFNVGDACADIAAALAALPNLSGTVDARGFVGTQPCSSNPFSGFNGQATVLLGAALYQAKARWIIPNRSRVLGIGAAVSTTGNTVIQWNGSAGGVVVQLGSGSSPNFGVFVGDLTIDCNASSSLTGMTGLLNNLSQEESGANDITFLSCDTYAVDLEPGTGGGSENSGPYTNLNIKYPNANSCNSKTIAFNYNGSTKRGIDGLTVVADSCAQIAVGVDVNGSGVASGPSADVLQAIHCENVGDCIRIGNSKSTSNTVVAGVTGCPLINGINSCTNVVHIASNASDVVVEGIGLNNGTSNVLQNDVTTPMTTITSSNLAFYALGHGANPSVITTDPSVTSQFNEHIGGSSDIAGTCTLGSPFPAGSCTVGFANNYNFKPVCTANSEGSTNALKVATTTSSLTITSSSQLDTSKVGYICIGSPN